LELIDDSYKVVRLSGSVRRHTRFLSVTRAGLLVLVLAGCEVEREGAPPPPSASEIAAIYARVGSFDVEMSGNVAQVTTIIDRDDYAMGGELWARASPYIFLFSPATQTALSEYPGLGGVRVIVRYSDGAMVAQARLDRATMTSGRWNQVLGLASRARSEGSARPGLMRDLVRWGEDNTDYQYNPDYISGP